jgi:hypothetical protein
MVIFAKGNTSLNSPSITVPEIIPSCAKMVCMENAVSKTKSDLSFI